MALDLFRLNQGIDIQLDDLSANANVLVGVGAPGGDTGVQDSAPVGTIYMRTDAETDGLQVYWKFQDTDSTDDWKQSADKAFIQAAVNGLSWREPVRVLDTTTYANLAAALAAANTSPYKVDGVAITAGDRILFTDLTSGTENVYIVSGTPGSFVFTQDLDNTLTDGDALLVLEGNTHADQQWIYDGGTSQWVQFGSAVSTLELSYIRTFIGKIAAGATPTEPLYPSNNIVLDASDLTYEIGRLDDAVGNLTFTTPNLLVNYTDTLGTRSSPGTAATDNITTNLQLIDDAFGSGNITNTGGNYTISDDATWNGGTLNLTTLIDQLNEGIGNATFTSNGTNIFNGDSTNTSINNLNEALIVVQDESLTIKGSQTAAVTRIMDYIAVADATEVRWMIQTRRTSNHPDRRAVEVHAITDGTNVDHSEYAVLRLGSNIAGWNVNTAVSSGLILTLNTLSGGSGYTTNTTYNAVPLTGGSGTGATANITITANAVSAVVIVNPGTGYVSTNSLSAAASNLGGGTPVDFSILVDTVTGTVMTLTVGSTPGVDYVVKRIAYSAF